MNITASYEVTAKSETVQPAFNTQCELSCMEARVSFFRLSQRQEELIEFHHQLDTVVTIVTAA